MSFKKYLQKQMFEPGLISLLMNPYHIARKGLFRRIKSLSHHIHGKTLDIGCGQKPYRSMFNVNEYIGMDIEQSGHDHSNEDIDVFYDGKTFPFGNESFDSIVCNQVLEHVFEPDLLMIEINRVLKPGGTFLLTVPFVWDEHEQPYDYARYSSFGLKYLLEKNDFIIIEQHKSVQDVGLFFQLINAYIYKITKIAHKRKYIRVFIKFIITFLCYTPNNILGESLRWILPRNKDLYLDNIILTQKQ